MPENDPDGKRKDRTVPLHELEQRKAPRTFHGYELRGELGRGGMGVVYRAYQLTLKRTVALKMLTGDYAADDVLRFRAEAEMAAGLQHPNIVHIHEVGEEDGVPFFSMEFVQGGTLGDLLLRGLPEPKVVSEMMMTLARAVHYAHRQGVVHRDLKPGNVLLGEQGEIKIADFGIAKRMDGEGSMTLTGAVMGTPVYMAPEQARGHSRKVGPEADVYALGALFYHLLTGRPPFLPEESDTALTLRVLQEDPVSPAWHRPEVPRDLETICLKALQKEPADRYSSADAMAEDLRRYLNDEPILAHPPTKIVRTVKWVKRHPMRLTGMLLLAALIGAGGQRWWQWEFYERTHVSWAWSMDAINGLLKPKVEITESQSQRMATSFKITRRGRHGPVTSVDLLNARGYPATARKIIGGDSLPNWLEGINGAQKPDERAQETTRIEFSFSGDDLREATGFERNHHITWRMIYEHSVDSNPQVARVRFVNVYGFDESSQRYAINAEFQRDASGRDVAVHFLTSTGKPAINREGVYGYKFERNAAGQMVSMTNLGRDDEPVANAAGLVSAAYTWDGQGRIIRSVYQDGKGRPADWNGVAATTVDYDALGNVLLLHRLNSQGKPCNGIPESWGLLENQRNGNGEFSEIGFYKILPDAPKQLVSKMGITYEIRGYPTEVTVTTPAQVTRMKFIHDDKGNVIEEQSLDEAGRLRPNKDGWAARRIRYEDVPKERCWRIEKAYFNEADKPTRCTAGFEREVTTWDLSGQLRIYDTIGHDMKKEYFYRMIARPEYDNEGRTIRRVDRFELADGQPASDTWSGSEREYDAAGHELVYWQTGCNAPVMGGPTKRTDTKWDADGKMIRQITEICDEKRQPLTIASNDTVPLRTETDYKDGRIIREWEFGYRPQIHGAPSWRTDTEWINDDLVRHRLRQAYDMARQPLAVVSNGQPARVEQVYNEEGQLTGINEDGFDQAVVGFASRVAAFDKGRFARISHTLNDRSSVEQVRVYIKEVTYDAQPASRQFQRGDQLVKIGDVPVTNIYAWTFGPGYIGGPVDILRDGRAIRLEGFNPGPFGILLEERADPVR